MSHREAIKTWLSSIELSDVHVIDWGSGSKPVSRYIKHQNCNFVTIDRNELIASDRRGPKHYEHDIQVPIDLDTANVAFCIEVLEHCWDGQAVLSNIYDNLEHYGRLYLSVPFMFKVHSDDDYHRYTVNGLNRLLTQAGFTVDSIETTGGSVEEAQGYLVEAHK